MTHAIRYFLIILLGSLPLSAYADKPTPGLYSITTQMESDMPIPTQTETMTECLTEEDLQQEHNIILGGREAEADCEISDYTMEGGKMAISMVCQTDGGEMTMNSEGTYSATGYTMTSNMQMTSGGMKINMKSTGVGKRIGDC